MTKQEIIELLDFVCEGVDPSTEWAIAMWSENDVLERAEGNGISITREEARAVIRNINYRQDNSIGISWDTIDCYLQNSELWGGV